MKRGDLVTISVSGDYGKPRPALVIQDDAFVALPSVTVLQLTSDIHAADLIRILVEPDTENCLRKPSQVMIDRAMTVPRTKVGSVFGKLAPDTMAIIDAAMQRFFGLGERAALG